MITLFKNVKEEASYDVSLNEVVDLFKTGMYKDIVEKYRSLKTDKEKRDFKANSVPCITISGQFKGKKSDDLVEHSGFIAMDFDKIDDIETAKSILYADPYTYYGFESISGNGICLIVKINPEKHLEAFEGLEKYYFETHGYTVDTATKNVNRLRFVSYDPQMYFNKSAKKYVAPAKRREQNKSININFAKSDLDFVVQQIQDKKLDLTANYSDWIAIGMAIKSHLGEEGINYFKAVSQFHPKYNEKEVEKKYRSFTNGKIKIGTFFYIAKINGLDLVTKKTQHINNAAVYAKKGRRTPEQIISQLEKIDGIKPSESREIVDKVYSNNNSELIGEDKDNILPLIEDYIIKESKIVYNEVTLKYEINGAPMTDRDFNSVFLNIKGLLPKASKDLVVSVIDSDRTPSYNPIQIWFAKNYTGVRTNLISRLAESINSRNISSPDNKETYTSYFLKKWMVGAVAMWHGDNSPLMLVLAGTRQNTGKSHFFRNILPEELKQYYAEAELTGDKDENLLMCSKIIIMNDEMSNKSNRDISVMKKLCSTQYFNIRRPYGKMSEDIRRISALCGTSNNLELINDPTGNRRIIPIEVFDINHGVYNDIDKKTLWAEAYYLYKHGYDHNLSNADIAWLSDNTEEYKEASMEAELILKYYEKPNADTECWVTEITNTDIKVTCELYSKQKLSSRKIGLELKRLGFEKKIKKVEGVAKQVYRVVQRVDENNVNHLNNY